MTPWILAGVLIVAAVYYAVRSTDDPFDQRAYYTRSAVFSAACAVTAAGSVLYGLGVIP